MMPLSSFSSRSRQKHAMSTLFLFPRQKSLSTSTQLFHHNINIQRKKQILQPHHAREIMDNYYNLVSVINGLSSNPPFGSSSHHSSKSLFEDFVQTVCSTSTIPRKELYEAWSSALIIHEHFPHLKRIADVACGHGLLSWSLLLLDYISNENGIHHHHERTAVCIDRRMPQSAEKIPQAMITKWPELEKKWDFVESKLDSIIPSSSTLICGIHPCGILSDQIISLAIHGNAPLALIPCCHAKKSLNEKERFIYNSIVKNNGSDDSTSNVSDESQSDTILSLREYIDNLRVERLESLDYTVTQTFIPKEYTPQNKLILANPSKMNTEVYCSANEDDARYTVNNMNNSVTHFFQQEKQKQFISRSHTPIAHPIPIGNDIESIKKVKKLSGRVQAEKRKASPPPSLCVSMFMPKSITITPDTLLVAARNIWDYNTVYIDYADDGPYLHPNGLLARTFRITYLEENKTRVEKGRAKQLHDEFCAEIVNLIDDTIQIRR